MSNTEMVNHPRHYGRDGAMECIDEMLLIFGVEAVRHFCLLNAWKYRYRAADKNGVEDLKKSDWYLRKYAELSGTDQPEVPTPCENTCVSCGAPIPEGWQVCNTCWENANGG